MSYRTHNPVVPAAPSLHFPLKGKKINSGPTQATMDALHVLVSKTMSVVQQDQLHAATVPSDRAIPPKRL